MSALNTTLAQDTKHKDKYKEQLEVIYTIKVNNMMMKKNIKEEQQELKQLKINPKQMAELLAQVVS